MAYLITLFLFCSNDTIKLYLAYGLGRVQQLPEINIPGQSDKADVVSSMIGVLAFGGKAALLAMGAFSVIIVCWQIISAFLQARDNAAWGRFGITFLIGCCVLLFVGVISQLAWSQFDSLQQL